MAYNWCEEIDTRERAAGGVAPAVVPDHYASREMTLAAVASVVICWGERGGEYGPAVIGAVVRLTGMG